MPLPKNVAAYPADYFVLFQKAINDGEVRIKLESERKAKALRLELNGFRNAVRHDIEGANSDLAAQMEGLAIYVEGTETIVRLRELKFGAAVSAAISGKSRPL